MVGFAEMSFRRRSRAGLLVFLAAALLLASGAGAAPVLRLGNIFPPAGAIGGKAEVTCTGSGLDQATSLHFSADGVSVKMVRATAGSTTFEITIAPGAQPGICE